MSYQTALTVKEAINDIDAKRYLLPSIQREFVWSTVQIEQLFDSLMQGYPINAFLFWKVPKEKTSDFQFYEFLRDYHQHSNRHNVKANTNGAGDIMAVLDGQQRLTSLYIGLKGSYSYKMPHRRIGRAESYPHRRMYLNILKPSNDSGKRYQFYFLTEAQAENHTEDALWFEVGKILNFNAVYEVSQYLADLGLAPIPGQPLTEEMKFASEALQQLFDIVHKEPTISYYLETSTELDKVLNIFIRVNSGGTTLSYSDLLLSFASAQWEKRDAREEILKLVDCLNEIGLGFNVNKDFVLKSALVLSDFSDISFKVDNFNKAHMLSIEKDWENISDVLRLAFRLVASFGFSRENISSNSLVIPIAYYLKATDRKENFITSSKYLSERKTIKKWFVAALLHHIFSFATDQALSAIRGIIHEKAEKSDSFPFAEITEKFRGTARDIIFDSDEVENLLQTRYESGDTLVILSMLYPWANLRNNFHVDHIFPKSLFSRSALARRGIEGEQAEDFIRKSGSLANLQLLEELPNIEKGNREFLEWLDMSIPDDASRSDYLKKHLIPDVDFAFENFLEFIDARESLLRTALERELISASEPGLT